MKTDDPRKRRATVFCLAGRCFENSVEKYYRNNSQWTHLESSQKHNLFSFSTVQEYTINLAQTIYHSPWIRCLPGCIEPCTQTWGSLIANLPNMTHGHQSFMPHHGPFPNEVVLPLVCSHFSTGQSCSRQYAHAQI